MTSIYDLNRSCKSDEKDCCPPFPHYTMPITDQDFVQRNIQLSNQGDGIDMMDTLHQYVYPGDLAEDEAKSMKKCEYDEWVRQEDVARRSVMPNKFWQDLNTGRRGYARGLSDNLDDTILERNNVPSGWFNGKCGIVPGGAPYYQAYLENHEPVDPMNYRKPIVNMTSMGNRHYFYSTYDLDDQNPSFCKCQRSKEVNLQMHAMDSMRGGTCPNCNKKMEKTWPERYN
jgi:hypothetical protein